MKLSMPVLGLLLYAMPALSALWVVPALGYEMSNTGSFVLIMSVVSSVVGYLISKVVKVNEVDAQSSHPNKSYLQISYFILFFGIVVGLLNFARIGSFPLFSGNEARVVLQSSVLWNLYILCSIGIFIFSFAESRRGATKVGWFLFGCYILLALMSAWKGVLLNFIFLFFLPRYKNSYLSVFGFMKLVFYFILAFVFINSLRGGSFFSTLYQPLFYIYWGFVNFDSVAIEASSSCLHSAPFVGCNFFVDDSQLISPTWNVYTALSPLYVDGGLPLVCLAFLFFGFILGFSQRKNGRLLYDYLFYVSFYYFFLSHNGYLLYSSFYFTALFLLVFLEFISKYYRKIPSLHESKK